MGQEEDDLFIRGIISLIEEVGKRPENETGTSSINETFLDEHLSRLEPK